DLAPGLLPIHIGLAVGAVHSHLIKTGLRCDANIIASTGYARDAHQIATLIGCGASAVYPYLSYLMLFNMVASGEILTSVDTAFKNYRKAINKGLMKILSKMGISTIASYRGALLFEVVGLADEVVSLCFPGIKSRIQGADFSDLQLEQQALEKEAWKERKPVSPGGLLKYVHGQEYHAFNPDVVQALHLAVQSGDYGHWRDYAGLVNQRPVATLRDLLKLRVEGQQPIPLAEVEDM